MCSLLRRRDRCIQPKSIALDADLWIDCMCPNRNWISPQSCCRLNSRWPDTQSPTDLRHWWKWIEPWCCIERNTMSSCSDSIWDLSIRVCANRLRSFAHKDIDRPLAQWSIDECDIPSANKMLHSISGTLPRHRHIAWMSIVTHVVFSRMHRATGASQLLHLFAKQRQFHEFISGLKIQMIRIVECGHINSGEVNLEHSIRWCVNDGQVWRVGRVAAAATLE